MSPTVSIIVSIFNEIDYFEQMLNSIIKQSSKDWELVVVVDTIDLKIYEKIYELTKNNNQIIILKNSKNLGLTKSLNIGLKNAKGRYIARIDADDIAHVDRIKIQQQFLDENLSIGIVGSWGRIIDEKGIVIGKIIKRTTNKDITRNLLFKNQLIHSSVMFRKSIIYEYRSYNENFYRSQDYEFWLSLRRKVKFHNINKFLIDYRKHSRSITQKSNIEQRVLGIKMMFNYYKHSGQYFAVNEKILIFFFFLKQFYKIIYTCFFKNETKTN